MTKNKNTESQQSVDELPTVVRMSVDTLFGDWLVLTPSTKMQAHVLAVHQSNTIQVAVSSVTELDIVRFTTTIGADDDCVIGHGFEGGLHGVYVHVSEQGYKTLKKALLNCGCHCPVMPDAGWSYSKGANAWYHNKAERFLYGCSHERQ